MKLNYKIKETDKNNLFKIVTKDDEVIGLCEKTYFSDEFDVFYYHFKMFIDLENVRCGEHQIIQGVGQSIDEAIEDALNNMKYSGIGYINNFIKLQNML